MSERHHATSPNPDRLRREVRSVEHSLPRRGDAKASMIELGCEGCDNNVSHSSGLYTLDQLQVVMDKARDAEGEPMPVSLVAGRFTCINVAEGCPIDQQTQKPICRFGKQEMNAILARAFKSMHEEDGDDD